MAARYVEIGHSGRACDLVQLGRGLSFDEFSLTPLCSGTASRAMRLPSCTGGPSRSACNRFVLDAGARSRLTPRAEHPDQHSFSLPSYRASRGHSSRPSCSSLRRSCRRPRQWPCRRRCSGRMCRSPSSRRPRCSRCVIDSCIYSARTEDNSYVLSGVYVLSGDCLKINRGNPEPPLAGPDRG